MGVNKEVTASININKDISRIVQGGPEMAQVALTVAGLLPITCTDQASQ